jgi:hypothetical protein
MGNMAVITIDSGRHARVGSGSIGLSADAADVSGKTRCSFLPRLFQGIQQISMDAAIRVRDPYPVD